MIEVMCSIILIVSTIMTTYVSYLHKLPAIESIVIVFLWNLENFYKVIAESEFSLGGAAQ